MRGFAVAPMRRGTVACAILLVAAVGIYFAGFYRPGPVEVQDDFEKGFSPVWSWETRVANYSPLLATGSGLLFNGSLDRYLRALDADSGKVIWETRLPSQTIGGAITYSVNGRQYVAIASGGGPVASTQVRMTPEADMTTGNNGLYVFALPQ